MWPQQKRKKIQKNAKEDVAGSHLPPRLLLWDPFEASDHPQRIRHTV
jgi:hypothetical protein